MAKEDVIVSLLRRKLSEKGEALALALAIYKAFLSKGRRGVRDAVLRWLEEVESRGFAHKEGKG